VTLWLILLLSFLGGESSSQKSRDIEVSSEPDSLAAIYNQAVNDLAAHRLTEAEAGLREAIRLLQERLAALPGEPQLVFFLASAFYNLGNILHSQGHTDQAIAEFEKAANLLRPLTLTGPMAIQGRTVLGQSEFNHANTLLHAGDFAGAAPHFQAARDVFEALVCEEPKHIETRHDLSRSHFNLAYAESMLGHSEEAIEGYRRAQPNWEVLLAEHPDLIEPRFDLARSYFNLGVLLAGAEEQTQAIEAYEKALAQFDTLVRAQPEAPHFVRCFDQALTTLLRLVDAPGALALRSQQVALLEFRSGRTPEDIALLRELGQVHAELSKRHYAARNFAEADSAMEKALATCQRVRKLSPRDDSPVEMLARLHYDRGIQQYGVSQWDDAERSLRDSLLQWESLHLKYPQAMVHVASVHNWLGIVFLDSGALQRAEPCFLKALEMRSTFAAEHPSNDENRMYLAGTLVNLGNVYRDREQFETATNYYNRALETLRSPPPPQTLASRFEVFTRNAEDGKLAITDEDHRQPLPPSTLHFASTAVRPAGPLPLSDPPQGDDVMTGNWARDLVRKGQIPGALQVIDDALKVTPGSESLQLDRADLLRALGQEEDAFAVIESLLQGDPDSVKAWFLRGLILGQFQEPTPSEKFDRVQPQRKLDAVESFEKVIALAPTHADGWLYRGRTLAALAAMTQSLIAALIPMQQAHPAENYLPYLEYQKRRFWLYFGRARESFEKVCELRPADARPWVELARHLVEFEPGFALSATVAYSNAVQRDPTSKEAAELFVQLRRRTNGDR
jgi:tetratricopeptide (TPR) repeat protein